MVQTGSDPAVAVDRIVQMFRGAMPTGAEVTLDDVRAGYEAVLADLPVRDDAIITSGSFGGVDGYWVKAEGSSDGRIGVMVHGGGFVMGSAWGYRAFAAEISGVTGARVFVPEYRLAPEHPFPSGLDDVRAVLTAAVLDVGPGACFAIGDSAGGGLVVSALMSMHGQGAGLPACVVLVSALIDLTVSNASFQDVADADPICAQQGTRRNVALYLSGQGPDEAPAAFPMHADLGWLPPSLVLVGGREVLRDDSRHLAAKLRREGASVELHEYDDMIHVWPLFSSFVPEGRQALTQIGAFVAERTAGSDSTGTGPL